MRELTYLSAGDVATACADVDPVAVVAEALARHAAGGSVLPEEAYLGWETDSGEQARVLAMPGMIEAAGVKVLGANPANPARGLARAAGLTILFDRNTARPICVMEAATISALRTAAVSALSARLLEGPPIERMAVIGAGALAAAHLDLLPAGLPALAEVRLHDLEPGRAQALGMMFERRLHRRDVRVRLAPAAERAIRGAELVVAVTTATAGYIELGWLAAGAVVVNVSLDDVLPEVVLGAERVVVDDWRVVRTDRRRMLGRMARDGLVTGPGADGAPVHAELGELLLGRRPGRQDDEERILVNPFGLAIEDVAMAVRVHAAARRLGLGMRLET